MVKLIILLAISLLLIPISLSVPPVATEFYGRITIDGSSLSSGTIIANASDGKFCGSFSISTSGRYGLLSCIGDDTDTAEKEGASGSEEINFYYQGNQLRKYSPATWAFGEFKEVNLSDFAVCGDIYCDAIQNETCSVCQIDCGPCDGNITGNGTGGSNTSSNATNGTIGGGGTSGGSGGGDSGAEGGEGGQGPSAGLVPQCKERWECGSWRPRICPVTEIQRRECIDLNNCLTDEEKPETERACRYSGTCGDGIRNNNESDIDCGGDLCASCSLGQRCNNDLDCASEYCDPARKVCSVRPPDEPPTIAHAKPPALNLPSLVVTCGNRMPWEVFIPLALLAFLPLILGELYIRYYLPRYHKKYRSWKQEEKFKHQIKLRGRFFWVTVALWIITIFVSFYSYLFIGCPAYVGIGLFMMIILAVVFFFAIYYLMRYFEYHEEKTHSQLDKMMGKHMARLGRLLSIEEKIVVDLEKELLEMSKEIKPELTPEDSKKMDSLTLNVAAVLDLREKNRSAKEAEQKLCDFASAFSEDASITNLGTRNLKMKGILNRLAVLSLHFKNEQGIEERKKEEK